MNVKDLVTKTRSYRRFFQEIAIERHTLEELVDLARLSASGANRQPLKYFLCCDASVNSIVFPHLSWAGYLQDWPGPRDGERPAGYIIVLGDTRISESFGCDYGIAAQSILLGATERGLGGCIVGSVARPELATALDVPAQFEILIVIALGVPKEEVMIEPVPSTGSIFYWRDSAGVHHVPKRSLKDILIN